MQIDDLNLDTVIDTIELTEFDDVNTVDWDMDVNEDNEIIDIVEDEIVEDEDIADPVIEETKVSKASLARAIFKEHYGKPGVARKDIIKMFEGIGLTKAGAATYYQHETTKLKHLA